MQFTDESAFAQFMLSDQPVRPANMQNVVAINQGKRPYAESAPAAPRHGADQAAQLAAAGHGLLDVRPVPAFGEGHLPGSLHVDQRSGSFEQFVGWVLPPEIPVILVAEDAAAAERALHKLAFVGLDRRVVGFLAFEDWIAAGRKPAALPQLNVETLQQQICDRATQVIDVRDPGEWIDGVIAGASRRTFKQLPEILAELELDPARPVSVICGSGLRSSIAASILRRRGIDDIRNVTGGMQAWYKAGLPVSQL